MQQLQNAISSAVVSIRQLSYRDIVTGMIAVALFLNAALLMSLTAQQTNNAAAGQYHSGRTNGNGVEVHLHDFNPSNKRMHNQRGMTLHQRINNNNDYMMEPVRRYIPQEEESLSGCMLIKDDNQILNEWLAYHYYTTKLRYLIVAVDPSSETSPSDIWAKWRHLTDLQIIEWKDPDFLPQSFIEKGYHISPKDISGDAKKSKWHEGHEDPAQVIADIMKINNHRFRQLSFYSRCLRHMREAMKTWVIHIDTDEYVVVNPLLRRNMNRYKNRSAGRKSIAKLETPSLRTPSAIFEFFTKGVMIDEALLSKSNYPCVSLPRLLFGSTESSATNAKTATVVETYEFEKNKFETLRWKYHTDFNDTDRNAQPKVIVDVSTVQTNDEMFQPKAFSIHRPSKRLCRRLDQMNLTQFQRFPLSVNHYIGSRERYFARNDTRRSERTYNFKSHVQNGVDDDWISDWLDGFIRYVGIDIAKELLDDYYIINHDSHNIGDDDNNNVEDNNHDNNSNVDGSNEDEGDEGDFNSNTTNSDKDNDKDDTANNDLAEDPPDREIEENENVDATEEEEGNDNVNATEEQE